MSKKEFIQDTTVTAILVDGGFYRRRSYACLGDKTPQERADELESYCKRHLNEKNMIFKLLIDYIESFITIAFPFLKTYITL